MFGAANPRTERSRGIFISFEGGEGAGKSTQVRFLSAALQEQGYTVRCLREPGGTAIGEALRELVLDPANDTMDARCELLIYVAARAQIVEEHIAPALARGEVVICDRFSDSTIAYQVFGRGLDRRQVESANDFACKGIRPDRTILMCAPDAEAGLLRASRRSGADRLEQAGDAFHQRVLAGFRQIAQENPERVRTVVSNQPKPETTRAVCAELADLFPWMNDKSALDAAIATHLAQNRTQNRKQNPKQNSRQRR